MTLSSHEIADRRRMRRRLTFWRIATLVVLAIALAALMNAAGWFERYGKENRDHIARVSISGVITDDRPLLKLLKDIEEKDSVKAVILDISSPGGSTVGGEAHYEAIRELSAKKPVVATVGTLAASAGYMIAAASDHIVARKTSIVGSIGVYFQYASAEELLRKIGLDIGMVKSSPLKAEPSPFDAVTEEEKAMLRNLVMDTYRWFVDIVADRRGMTRQKAESLADGSIYSGRQALESGLVDEIGGEETARKWLVSEKGISNDLKIEEWKPKRPSDGLFLASSLSGNVITRVAKFFGIELSQDDAGKLRDLLPERLFLDGLQSMLQVDGSYQKIRGSE